MLNDFLKNVDSIKKHLYTYIIGTLDCAILPLVLIQEKV